MDRRPAPLLRAKYVVVAEYRWRALALLRHRCSRLPSSPMRPFEPTNRRSRSVAGSRRCASPVGWPGPRIRRNVRLVRWRSTSPKGQGSGGALAGGAGAGAPVGEAERSPGRGRAGQAQRNHPTVPRLGLGLSPHRASPDGPRSPTPVPAKPAWHDALCSSWWTCRELPRSSRNCGRSARSARTRCWWG
jgi:hypothetical protein